MRWRGEQGWLIELRTRPRGVARARCDDGGRSSVGRAPGCDPGCRGFESRRSPQTPLKGSAADRGLQLALCRQFEFGPLAQLVEQETLNLLVEGSSPSRPTNIKDLPLRKIQIAAATRHAARCRHHELLVRERDKKPRHESGGPYCRVRPGATPALALERVCFPGRSGCRTLSV
jgi:hypothetical protein